jgi:sugar phosphate isomerase/epimerase
MSPTRRRFLRSGALSAAALLGPPGKLFAADAKPPLFSAMGMSGPVARAAELKALGAGFLTVSTADLLVPDQPEEVFAPLLEKALAAPLPVLACNGFIRPGHLLCVGPKANHDEVLVWAETAFKRLARVKAKFMVFGSGGSRNIPEGWPPEKADEQFVALLKRMGPLAENAGVTVAVEQLQASECNFINHITHAAKLIRTVGHPHIRVLADLFHIARGGDTPEDLKSAMDVVVQIEIAEKGKRTYPGIAGNDFRPFFRVLRETGYKGAVSIEGTGKPEQLPAAFAEIARQAAEA